MTATRKFFVTAVYADVIDTPQAYEPGEIEAASAEEAETIARRCCIADNGGDPDNPDDASTYALTDLYARPVGGEPTATWQGHAVTESQHTTLTLLAELLQGSWSEQRGYNVVIGTGHRSVSVEPDGTVHAV